MKKKLLCAALLAGIGVAGAANAQQFDDRWYITGSTGFNIQDNDRGTRNAPFGTLGFGKFFNPQWSFDVEFNYQNPNFDGRNNIVNPAVGIRGQDLNWSQYGVSLDLRRHFTAEGRSWNPYALFGVGFQRSEEEFDAFPNPNSPGERKDGNFAAKVGVGLQGGTGRVRLRTELAMRTDFDDSSFRNSNESAFHDVLASVGLVIPLGPEPTRPIGPAPLPPVADTQYCPDGTVMGPDGCPVPLTIDLRGVNFDFDRATLRPDAVATLNEAVEILRRYPDLRVEVAGHTDLCGTEVYNQGLSERRARAVYDYLTSNGVSAGRLAGPVGYGESRPLVPTPQSHPACRNETNRRTELNVQN